MSSLSGWRRNARSAVSVRAGAVVAGAGLNMLVNTGPVLLFSFGVFVKPIIAETGWSRTSINSAVLYGQILLALCGPLTGLAVDRFGARCVARFAGPYGEGIDDDA
ncbi:MAG TPA: hypothetical protein VEN30_05815 [Paraburkholderia sp.]|nr:hypothetical protein [Paraburkholderia sp.]